MNDKIKMHTSYGYDELPIKRFYLEPFNQKCPNCGHEEEYDQYLSFPKVYEEFEVDFYCSECECEWSKKATLNIELTFTKED